MTMVDVQIIFAIAPICGFFVIITIIGCLISKEFREELFGKGVVR